MGNGVKSTPQSEVHMIIKRGQRLRLSLTAKCPLRCSFCHGDGNTHPSKHKKDHDVPLKDVISVIDLFAKKGFSTIRFTGGEPGAYKFFSDLITYIPQLKADYPSVTKWGLTTAAIPFLVGGKLNCLANSG